MAGDQVSTNDERGGYGPFTSAIKAMVDKVVIRKPADLAATAVAPAKKPSIEDAIMDALKRGDTKRAKELIELSQAAMMSAPLVGPSMADMIGDVQAVYNGNIREAVKATYRPTNRWENLRSRRGVVKVMESAIEKEPDAFMRLMASCIVLRCESKPCMTSFGHEFEYVIVSPMMDAIEEGMQVPEYIVESNGGGSLRFVRAEVAAVKNRMLNKQAAAGDCGPEEARF